MTMAPNENLVAPSQASEDFSLATRIVNESTASQNLSSLNTAIYLLRHTLYHLISKDGDLSECASLLATALLTRWGCTGMLSDVEQAFACHLFRIQKGAEIWVSKETILGGLNEPESVEFEVDDSVQTVMSCAFAIVEEFHRSVDLPVLDRGIALYRKVLSLCDESSPIYWKVLVQLSNSLVTRYRDCGDAQNIADAISFLRRLLLVRPNRIMSLHAAILLSGPSNAANLKECISLTAKWQKSIDEAMKLFSAAKAHGESFRASGNVDELRQAHAQFQLAEERLPWGYHDRSAVLMQLANARLELSVQIGDVQAFDVILELQREAIQVVPEDRPARLALIRYSMGMTFYRRFTQSGAPADLNESISIISGAVDLLRIEGEDYSPALSALGFALHERFTLTGDLADLENAISDHREALGSAATSHDRAGCLNNLGRALLERFLLGAETSAHDLETAISCHDEALELRPYPHPSRSVSLNNLAQCYNERFEWKGEVEDVNCAIRWQREALGLRPPGHLERVATLSNLATSLQTRYRLSADLKDLTEAIEMHRECLQGRKGPHIDRDASLHNLALCLGLLFDRTHDRGHLEESIQLNQQALARLKTPNPERPSTLLSMARSQLRKYDMENDPQYLEEAFEAYREASTYQTSSIARQFMISDQWCMDADEYHHMSALEAYSTAIALLPQLAMFGLDLESRRKALTSGSDGLACRAAVCALRLGDLGKAVEFLEAGRSVFWSQALQLRTPLHELEHDHPEAAAHLLDLFKKLEHGSYRDVHSILNLPPEAAEHMRFEAETAYYRRLNSDLSNALKEVRGYSGFNDFLLPKSFSTLEDAARNGPVVILNVSRSSCTALIITLGLGIQALTLPDMTQEFALYLVYLLRQHPTAISQVPLHIPTEYFSKTEQAVSAAQTRLTGELEAAEHLTPNKTFEMVLSTLWISVVEPVVCVLNLKKSQNPPRLWWCPTGPLSFLPLHAAGIYTVDQTNCVSEYVVSSYTPSLAALLDIPQKTITPFKMTAIIQPQTPNLRPLPSTRVELSKIEARVPKEWLTSLGRASDTTVQVALAHLRESAIVHFACHGTQDFRNPLESGLVLADGMLKVLEIMRRPDDAEGPMGGAMSLAFLSACETAKGDQGVPDEAMHIAASLLFAGFRGVIATMWAMHDPDGPRVADIFYRELFKTSGGEGEPVLPPDLTQAARALHHAILKLREEPNMDFIRWVPFVHYGL
ncbi:CHAT domain-containing protein [Mycena latifolia]|nr:CHAT domain-containing protein [Mycena latifolia]